ncbi:MAG: hypothetical protein WBA77_19535 [Microcoleaceae cyanobacterium]
MKLSNFKLSVRLVGLMFTGFGISIITLSPQAAAQSQGGVDPLQDLNRRNVEGQSGDGLNQNTMFDLIHQAQQGGFNIDYEAIQKRQDQSIQDAAATFREKQQQLLQQQQLETNTDPE